MCFPNQLNNFPSILYWHNCPPPPPPTLKLLPALHVHYTLYEFSNRTMYGTVGSLLGNCCGRLQGSVIRQLVGPQWSSAVFLKLRSASGIRGFQKIKSRKGGRVVLALLHLYVLITVPVETVVTNHYVTDSTLTVNSCVVPHFSNGTPILLPLCGTTW